MAGLEDELDACWMLERHCKGCEDGLLLKNNLSSEVHTAVRNYSIGGETELEREPEGQRARKILCVRNKPGR